MSKNGSNERDGRAKPAMQEQPSFSKFRKYRDQPQDKHDLPFYTHDPHLKSSKLIAKNRNWPGHSADPQRSRYNPRSTPFIDRVHRDFKTFQDRRQGFWQSQSRRQTDPPSWRGPSRLLEPDDPSRAPNQLPRRKGFASMEVWRPKGAPLGSKMGQWRNSRGGELMKGEEGRASQRKMEYRLGGSQGREGFGERFRDGEDLRGYGHIRGEPERTPRMGGQGEWPIQIIQQINIQQVKNQSIHIVKEPQRGPKRGARGEAGKTPKYRTVSRKMGGQGDPRAGGKKQHLSSNLRTGTNRLREVQRKMAKSGVQARPRKKDPRAQVRYKLKHVSKKPGNETRRAAAPQERDLARSYGRIKAATTSMKKSYGNAYLKKSAYDKKKKKAKKKLPEKEAMERLGNAKSRRREAKTGYYAKIGRSRPDKQGPKRKAAAKRVADKSKRRERELRQTSLYQAKGAKPRTTTKTPKMGKSAAKRYVFKSQKLKEKQMQRQVRLREEMKRLNEQDRAKQDMDEVLAMGLNVVERRARNEIGAKELLSLVKKGRGRAKKARGKRGAGPKGATVSVNKLRHFRDSLKQSKLESTLGSNGSSQQKNLFSEYAGSRERLGRAADKEPGLSFGQSRRLKEKRERKHKQNKIRSLNHLTADNELKNALRHIQGTLEGIDSIRRSGLREKTTRSLSKKLSKFKWSEGDRMRDKRKEREEEEREREREEAGEREGTGEREEAGERQEEGSQQEGTGEKDIGRQREGESEEKRQEEERQEEREEEREGERQEEGKEGTTEGREQEIDRQTGAEEQGEIRGEEEKEEEKEEKQIEKESDKESEAKSIARQAKEADEEQQKNETEKSPSRHEKSEKREDTSESVKEKKSSLTEEENEVQTTTPEKVRRFDKTGKNDE